MRGTREVSAPCTSSWILTPFSSANGRTRAATCRSARASSLPAPPSAARSAGPSRSAIRGPSRASPTPSSRRCSCGRPPDPAVVLAGGAESADLHRRVLESLAHLRPRRRRQRDLHAVLVRRPQLDAVEADVGEVLDQRREVPVLRDVVGDGAELQALPARRQAEVESAPRLRCRVRERRRRSRGNSRRFMAERIAQSLIWRGLRPEPFMPNLGGPPALEGAGIRMGVELGIPGLARARGGRSTAQSAA